MQEIEKQFLVDGRKNISLWCTNSFNQHALATVESGSFLQSLMQAKPVTSEHNMKALFRLCSIVSRETNEHNVKKT